MKKKTNITKVSKKVSNAPVYRASIKIFGKTLVAGGSTISEAIGGLVVPNCKGKSIITVEHGEVKKDRVLQPMLTFRLFNTYGLSREIALKNVSLMFDGL